MTNPSATRTSGVHAILPIKNLTGVKTRLGSILSADERLLLVRAMAEDVVVALKAAKGLAGISVVSHDERVGAWAKSHELDLVDDTAVTGLSAAVALAASQLRSRGAEAILVVLADAPFATPEDFEALIAMHEETAKPHLILAPSRDNDGSNGLLLAPPGAISFHYGVGSAKAHAEEARRKGLEVLYIKGSGLAHDIDTGKDLRDLVASAKMLADHSRTAEFLTSSGIAARMAQKKR